MRINKKSMLIVVIMCLMVIVFNNLYVKAATDNEENNIVKAEDLIKIYMENNKSGDSIFKEKNIEITGKVDSINKNFYVSKVNMKGSGGGYIVFRLNDTRNLSSVKKGEVITIKGVCTGKFGNNIYINESSIVESKS
ncbi:OB-fold protein [Clostridium hydrogeniformans]|uniref:OB-fold protein n=1 Tax=Clostridium hydrogeniformans TaxID=349933 RepID=UPI00047FAB57|nr:hypothetical protein [Clostridium hydrogeniformans]